MKALKIIPLLIATAAIPGLARADQAFRPAQPLFNLQIAEPWDELERAIVVNDSARYDDDALSANDVNLEIPEAADYPG